MTKKIIKKHDLDLDKISSKHPEQTAYIEACKEAGVELKLIHSIVKAKLELLELIGNDKYLIGLYKELEEIFPCSKIIEILKANIKIKEITSSNPKILTNKKLVELLKNSIIRSPSLLPLLENYTKETIAA